MIPYSDFYYFYILAIILIHAIIIGCLGKKIKYYGIFATAIVLYLIYGNSKIEIIFLTIFLIDGLIIYKIYYLIRNKYNQRWILWISIFFAICPLIITKISPIVFKSSLGFLGISYLTFKLIQILIQTFDGTLKELKLLDFFYFILFFPTITSGPIDKSNRFLEDINTRIDRKEYLELLGDGIFKIIKGLAYKFILAYLINTYLIKPIGDSHTLISVIKYMYSYSLYLFFDFAGYSSIAIGVSNILGVRTPDNFNAPFVSKDMKEFWNRWHMSLSFWFRDFVYTRFVMASMKNKWFKNKYITAYVANMITMGLMGIWHGLELNYIVYGLYQGVLLGLNDKYNRSKFYKKNKKKRFYKPISIIVTIHLVCLGFLIFSGYIF